LDLPSPLKARFHDEHFFKLSTTNTIGYWRKLMSGRRDIDASPTHDFVQSLLMSSTNKKSNGFQRIYSRNVKLNVDFSLNSSARTGFTFGNLIGLCVLAMCSNISYFEQTGFEPSIQSKGK